GTCRHERTARRAVHHSPHRPGSHCYCCPDPANDGPPWLIPCRDRRSFMTATNPMAMPARPQISSSGSTTPSGRLLLAEALAPFSDSAFDERRDVQRSDTDQPLFKKGSNHADATTSEILFGPFRLLPAQFLLMEGDKPVPLGSRALELLIVLLGRPGELVSKQELMARVWPNTFVEPANL